MSVRTALIEYQLQAGKDLPVPLDVLEHYLQHTRREPTVEILDTIIGDGKYGREWVGLFKTPAQFARALTAQSLDPKTKVQVDQWPFNHVDWDAAGTEAAAMPQVTRIADHWFVKID